MPTQLSELLTQLFPAAILAVLGSVIRTNGPQGFVHGMVDWSKVDDATRRRAGRDVGNLLFAMAIWIAGYAVFRYQGVYAQATNNLARVIFVGGISVLVIVMIFVLLRLRETKPKHGR